MSQELPLIRDLEEGILEPTLHIVEVFHRDRVDMNGSSMEILEYHDEIKVLQSELDLSNI